MYDVGFLSKGDLKAALKRNCPWCQNGEENLETFSSFPGEDQFTLQSKVFREEGGQMCQLLYRNLTFIILGFLSCNVSCACIKGIWTSLCCPVGRGALLRRCVNTWSVLSTRSLCFLLIDIWVSRQIDIQTDRQSNLLPCKWNNISCPLHFQTLKCDPSFVEGKQVV